MHERGLMAATVAALHEAALREAALREAVLREAASGASKPTPVASPLARVVLGVGPGVNRAAAEAAWAVAASGTAVARARVDWVRVDDVLVCLDCQREFTGGRLSVCPSCGADALVVGPAAEVTVLEWEAGRPAAEDEAST